MIPRVKTASAGLMCQLHTIREGWHPETSCRIVVSHLDRRKEGYLDNTPAGFSVAVPNWTWSTTVELVCVSKANLVDSSSLVIFFGGIIIITRFTRRLAMHWKFPSLFYPLYSLPPTSTSSLTQTLCAARQTRHLRFQS